MQRELQSHALTEELKHVRTPQSAAHKEVCAELEEGGWNVCWLCGVRGEDCVMDTHLAGRKHRQQLELCVCKTCGIKTTGTQNMLSHLNGAKHKVCAALRVC